MPPDIADAPCHTRYALADAAANILLAFDARPPPFRYHSFTLRLVTVWYFMLPYAAVC